MEAVLNFLTDINPDIEYNVIPLNDLYGPTKDDPKLQVGNANIHSESRYDIYKCNWNVYVWFIKLATFNFPAHQLSVQKKKVKQTL